MHKLNRVVGIDEAGRGSWAGPLVAVAVILSIPIHGLNDSKKLSKLQRAKLKLEIESSSIAIGIGVTSVEEINKFGLTYAESNAMQIALDSINEPYDLIIIDGNYNYLSGNNKVETLIRADSKVIAVSAASILAKVTRDNMMQKIAKQYPRYGFDKHAGYGTKLHLENIQKFGVTSEHRINYKPIAKILASKT